MHRILCKVKMTCWFLYKHLKVEHECHLESCQTNKWLGWVLWDYLGCVLSCQFLILHSGDVKIRDVRDISDDLL